MLHQTQRMIDRVEARIDTTPPKVSAVKVVVPLEEELVNEPTQLRDRRDRVHDLLLGTTIDIELQEGVRGTAKVSRAPVPRGVDIDVARSNHEDQCKGVGHSP